MSASPRFFLQENGLRTGPHSLAVLRQKAEIHVIGPDTSIAPDDAPDDWSPIRESQVLAEELFPRRTPIPLSRREIEIVNHPASAEYAPSVEEMLRDNLARQRVAEGELLRSQPPRSNRRLKDYLFTVAAGAVISMIPWMFIPLTTGLVFLSLAATAFVALSSAWVFFVVMDRY